MVKVSNDQGKFVGKSVRSDFINCVFKENHPPNDELILNDISVCADFFFIEICQKKEDIGISSCIYFLIEVAIFANDDVITSY